jgi:AcrR family transcriptional regulator
VTPGGHRPPRAGLPIRGPGLRAGLWSTRRVGRRELHSADAILDAARELVLSGGARATTMDRLVTLSGAPKGSIYHRFGTLDDLLAALWLRAARRSQAGFRTALAADDPTEAAVAAALSLVDFAASAPGDATLLAALRLADLVTGVTDAGLRAELEAVNAPLLRELTALTARLTGGTEPTAVEVTTCAVVDLPLGALRRHLLAGSAPPPGLRTVLEAAVRAALAAGR